MIYFNIEIKLGLVKKVNDETSFINIVIPKIIIKFLNRYQSELNINIQKYKDLKLEGIRYLYNEEVEELKFLANKALNTVKDKNNTKIFDNYRNKNDFVKEDVVEILQHIIYLCNMAIKGQKLLYIATGYDDSTFIES